MKTEHMDHVSRPGEAHVWVMPLDASLPDKAMLTAWLSTAERIRAAAIAEPTARHVFILARIAVRGILSGYVHVSPGDIKLALSTSGKPVMSSPDGWRFSLSHSGRIAAIAVARADVGVDVERARRLRRPARTARRVLHPETVSRLESMPAERRASEFLDAWTQREAHVKAVGGGLFRTPDVLPFTAGMLADAALRQVRDRDTGEIWSIARFMPDAQTRGAVVVRGRADALLVHDEAATLERIAQVPT